jgi:hypothetical protein
MRGSENVCSYLNAYYGTTCEDEETADLVEDGISSVEELPGVMDEVVTDGETIPAVPELTVSVSGLEVVLVAWISGWFSKSSEEVAAKAGTFSSGFSGFAAGDESELVVPGSVADGTLVGAAEVDAEPVISDGKSTLKPEWKNRYTP